MRQKRWIDPFAVVADRDARVSIDAIEFEVDDAAGGCELDRVRQNVADHLLHAIRIGINDVIAFGIDRCIECDLAFLCGRSHRRERRFDDAAQMRRLQIDLKLAEDDARDIEHVVDEARLQSRARFDRLERLFEFFLRVAADAKELHPSENGRHRRAQLV